MDDLGALSAATACEFVSGPVVQAPIRSPGVRFVEPIRVTSELPVRSKFLRDVLREVLTLVGMSRGHILYSETDTYVVFRGTSTINPVPLGARASLDDFVGDFAGRFGWLLNIAYAYSQELLDGLAGLGQEYPGIVHAGIAAILAYHDWDHIRAAAEGAGKDGIVLAGFSQGGALATLAAHRLRQEGFAVREVYTFGSPRVGDAEFGSSYSVPHRRFEGTYDIVPMLCPPPSDIRPYLPAVLRKIVFPSSSVDTIDYRHVGELVYLAPDGTITHDYDGLQFVRVLGLGASLLRPELRARLLGDHRTGAYVAALMV
jgi:Lipase (class 3)